MANESFISIPSDLSDETVLRRVISVIVEKLDIAVGNKGVQDNSLETLKLEIISLSERIEELES